MPGGKSLSSVEGRTIFSMQWSPCLAVQAMRFSIRVCHRLRLDGHGTRRRLPWPRLPCSRSGLLLCLGLLTRSLLFLMLCAPSRQQAFKMQL